MTDTPPETWTDELLFLDGFPSFEQLQRRLLNQAPSPVGDNATLVGDGLSDALLTVAREVTAQLDRALLSPLDGLMDLLAPLTGALRDWLVQL